jgi:hypothetical protein
LDCVAITKSPKAEAERHARTEEKLASETLNLRIWTTVLALATVLLAGGTVWLAWDSRDKGRHELRAYVGIVGGTIIGMRVGRLRFALDARNTGRTPARNVRYFMDADIVNRGEARNFDVGERHPHSWTMVPGAVWTLQFPPPNDRENLEGRLFDKMNFDDAVGMGREKEIIVWGEIVYNDIFSDEVRRTRFRYRRGVRQAGLDGTPDGVLGMWAPEPDIEGNEAT